ncbi:MULTISPECIES: phosphate ABC transporter permease PstA [unclassified Enterococcus]|uniref:phosphate ABC transporter permease PstA n=1 Tax=unclassified Enterococcus TaxID=2608891 RepID=UPI0015537C10|nr:MULTISPECIES: phosphate ABC transporter permease PstA [unclassified Enterococcus]MBS7576665.1 phosphate ABC transporter permease PstA [Enterococcus sp. MMGLQ5-2]MBS7583848.1 phosphate ABC transporter permease PstA [Enterococcus sp. MMGLQ5-1]NPD11709.1 phosphate ABC transporter permease PstA [Enterococcus sp. MMGLQ5-1]NPD36502.1 phosphate ABC transporter permease PstA [Enterococcus sp. MMGLQ5-2]
MDTPNTSKQILDKPKRKGKTAALILKLIVWFNMLLVAGVILWMVGYILMAGIPNIHASLFDFTYNSENVSLMPALINTLSFVLMVLLFSCPIGISAAVFFVEYSAGDSKLIKFLRITTETLSGVPSIVFGLFGYLCFVIAFKMGYSMLAGCLTLAIMVLPVIIRTTEESLLAVPQMYREGSYALGAGKVRTIFRIILPAALPGISSGIILSVGRIVGETAALIYTAGTLAQVATPMSSGRTLAIHMFALLSEGTHVQEANATAVILLVLVIILNFLASFVVKALKRG